MCKINLRIRKIPTPFPGNWHNLATPACHPTRMQKSAHHSAQPEPHSLDRATFGGRIRAARKRFGWTLQDLANASGVSITTISRAERGLLALGYENFSALAHALQLDMGSLFAQEGVAAEPFTAPVVTRAGRGVVYWGEAFAYEFLASSVVGKQMIPSVGLVHAREINGPGDFARHAGEEFLYVISGAVEVHFETGEQQLLREGDSIYFDSRIGHAYKSVSKQIARIVGVTTSESGMMRIAKAGKEEPSLTRVPKAQVSPGTARRKSAKPAPPQTATRKADTQAKTTTKARANPKRL